MMTAGATTADLADVAGYFEREPVEMLRETTTRTGAISEDRDRDRIEA
mgnify:CR=1 FL=1